MAKAWTIAVIVASLGAAWAQEAAEPYGLLVVEAVGTDGYISVETDLPALAKALGLGDAAALLDPPPAFLERGDQLVPLVMQRDDAGAGKTRLTLLLPETPLPAHVRLYLAGPAPEGEPSALDTALSVQQDGGRIVVNNGFAEVVHDAAVDAGLPSRVTFAGSGKVLEGFFLNDRVYLRDLGQFFARSGQDAEVRLLGSGPIEATVEVTTRFAAGDQMPDSAPEATLRFHYRAGTPAIEVTAHYTQSTAFSWDELHLMEWNLPGRPLPQWAKGTPTESGTFEKDNESLSAGQWACLTDGTNVVGVICDNPKLYSGSGGYGSYVHGPWVSWTGVERDLACVVWLDATANAVERLASYSISKPQVRITTPAIEGKRVEAARLIDALPAGRVRSLHRWWLAMTERRARETAALGAIREELDAQLQQLGAAANVDALAAVVERIGQRDGRTLLDNSDAVLRLGNAAEGYALLGFYSIAGERELLSGRVGPIWTLAVEGGEPKSREWSSLSEPFTRDIKATAEGCVLTWTGTGEAAGLNATVEMRLAGPAVSMTLAVDNASDALSLMEVQFPQVALGPIGDDSGDDVFLRPEVSGTLTKAPLLNGLHCNTTYPSGWGSLQFMAQYDGDCGCYLAAHDPVGSLKHMRAESSGDEIATAIAWPAADASRPGNDFEPSGVAVLSAFTGDWFDAAQVYRAWASTTAQWWPQRDQWGRPETADWMKDICIWALANGSAEQVVGPVKKFAEFMGVPTAVHWYCWHEIPFDDNYPHYFPVKPGFAEGVAALQAAGVRVMPYINGRLWDSDTDDFQTVALPAATKDRDGAYYVEEYGSKQKLVPMCPTQKVWQDKVQEIVLRLMSPECNVDGVYIDQVAAAAPRECYDASHGHPLRGGHWWTTDGYWPMLEALNRTIDERYPGKFLTTECDAEPYTQVFDGYLTWHFQYDGAVPVFAAIYGGKIQTFSRAYNGNDQLAHRMKTAQALVFGEQLGWITPTIVDEHPDTAAFLRRCARIRHKLLSHLSRGYMARPPAVSGNLPDITADWAWSGKWMVTDSALQRGAWRAEDGSVAFVFANASEASVSCTWHFDAARYGLPPGDFQRRDVTEESESDWTATEGVFDEALTVAAAGVQAVVIRRTP